MAIDKAIKYKDQKLTKKQKKKIKPANQGGGPNYLGKQETVTVPKKWLSDPDHVVAELAYITPKEQKILLDANIYGSLDGKPNKGPGGIMSLQGDLGGYDASPGGPNSGGGGGNRVGQTDRNKQRVQDILRGNVTTGQTVAPSNRVKAGAVPEFVGDNYVGSAYKSYGQPSFFGDLFSGGASGYRSTYGTQPGFFGNLLGRGNSISTIGTPGMPGFGYVSSDPRVGQTKPGFGGRFLGGLASLLTGVPLVGSVIGSAIDYGKGIFGPKDYVGYDDMSDFNRLTMSGVDPVLADNYLDLKIIGENESPSQSELVAKVTGPALIQMRTLEKKKAMSEYGGTPLTSEEENKLNQLKKMDADQAIYSAIV